MKFTRGDSNFTMFPILVGDRTFLHHSGVSECNSRPCRLSFLTQGYNILPAVYV